MYDEMENHIERWNESEPWVSEESVYQFVDNMNNFAVNRQPEAKYHILNQFDLDSYHELVLFNETPQLGYIYLNNNEKLKAIVFDFSGKVVINEFVLNKLDISHLEKGTYILNLGNGINTSSHKIIKN